MGIFWGHVVKNLKDTHFIDWRNWMGKERMKVCSILLCLAVLLCGCQEAPKEVQERMDRYGDSKYGGVKAVHGRGIKNDKDVGFTD